MTTGFYIGTTSESGSLRNISYANEVIAHYSPERKWDEEKFVRFFTRNRLFLHTLREARRNYDFDPKVYAQNIGLRNLTEQEIVMVDSLAGLCPFDSSEEFKTKIHEIRNKRGLDELSGRFWR